jgi:hypothetical protein
MIIYDSSAQLHRYLNEEPGSRSMQNLNQRELTPCYADGTSSWSHLCARDISAFKDFQPPWRPLGVEVSVTSPLWNRDSFLLPQVYRPDVHNQWIVVNYVNIIVIMRHQCWLCKLNWLSGLNVIGRRFDPVMKLPFYFACWLCSLSTDCCCSK